MTHLAGILSILCLLGGISLAPRWGMPAAFLAAFLTAGTVMAFAGLIIHLHNPHDHD